LYGQLFTFLSFVFAFEQEFDLVDKKELAPLQELIDTLLARDLNK
jgi:hypothetical protein